MNGTQDSMRPGKLISGAAFVVALKRPTRNWTPYDRDLAHKLSDSLIAFAKHGNPGTAAIPWPRYDPADEQMMEFGDSIRGLRMNTRGLNFFRALTATTPSPAAAGVGRRH